MFCASDAEVGQAAGAVLVLARLDRLGDRDHVGRLALLDQLGDVAEDAAVVVAVEILGRDQVGDLVEGLVVEQQAAQQRLLGLDRMRRHLQREQLGIGRARCGALGVGPWESSPF